MPRTHWHELPPAVRRAVEKHTGPVHSARTADHGVMSAVACTLRTKGGPFFVKGVRADHRGAWVYACEAQVSSVAPLAPRPLWDLEADGWRLYAYEYLEGKHPNLSPGSSDLTALVHTLVRMSETRWPEAVPRKPLHTRWADLLPESSPTELEGRALAHTDLSPLNMLRTEDGQLRMLDWALAAPGPDWADTAFSLVRLIHAGHTPAQAEEYARQVPAYRNAPAAHLTHFARILSASWAQKETADPLPHRAALTRAARAWESHRQAVHA